MEHTQNISDERLAEIIDAGTNCFKICVPAEGEKLARELLQARGELLALREELRLQKGANAAQDERERKAAARLGMVHCCDWPEQAADELLALQTSLKDAAKVHINILNGTVALTKTQAIHIAGLPADIEEQLLALRASHKRLVEALEGVQPYMDAAETAGLVGDEGCHWPVEIVRAALAEARKLEGK